MNRIALATTALAALLIALTGCDAGHAEQSTDSRVIVIAIDVPALSRSGSLAGRIERSIQEIASSAAPGDRILAYRITSHTAADAFFEVDIRVPQFNPMLDNMNDFRHQRRTAADSLIASVYRMLRDRPDPTCSDLLHALDLPAAHFRSLPPETERHLVILSPMVHDCTSSFLRLDISETGIDRFISRELEAGRIPALEGVTIRAIGAGADRRLHADRLMRVEAFWHRFFDAAGTSVRSYAGDLVW